MASNSRQNQIELLYLLREKRIRESRESFFVFCQTIAPDFYLNDRPHLKELCETLQGLYEGTLGKKKLIIMLPPRHGKSRTLVNFCMWVLGKSKKNRIITCSYNDDQATEFSRFTRDGIELKKVFPYEIDYSDIFPNTKMSSDNKSYQKWALDGEFFNYKGSGIGGSITGKGANISIVDDPVKDAEAAFNELSLDKIYRWYIGTFISRKEEGAIEIICMTRWAHEDLIGRVLKTDMDAWHILKMEAYDREEDQMLCPALLSKESYQEKSKIMDSAIFNANYHHNPVNIEGRLYKAFKIYSVKPEFERIINYTDTADQGNDYLCSISAGVYQNELYILNVYYTAEGMEITEPATAEMFLKDKVSTAYIESNNGGRGFARAVQRILTEKYATNKISIQWFTQTKNKQSRILTNSNFVMEHVYFPELWAQRFPEFYHAISSYQGKGKNKHDDAADALTGLVEMIDTIRIMPVEISASGKRFF